MVVAELYNSTHTSALLILNCQLWVLKQVNSVIERHYIIFTVVQQQIIIFLFPINLCLISRYQIACTVLLLLPLY